MEKVLFMVLAHNKLADRSDAVMAAIREMLAAEGSGMSCMCPGGAGRGEEPPREHPETSSARLSSCFPGMSRTCAWRTTWRAPCRRRSWSSRSCQAPLRWPGTLGVKV